MKNLYMPKRTLVKTIICIFMISSFMLLIGPFSIVNAQDENLSNFTGTILDEGVDSDDDGYFDYLHLGVEVNITTAGIYTIDGGGLYDSATNLPITISDVITLNLDEGIHVVDLELNGTEIYISGINPTHVASIFLYDEASDEIDQLFDQELSTQYTFDEFQRPISIFEITKINREIVLDQDANIHVINQYSLFNLGFRANEITLGYPEGAYDFEVRDEMGELETSTENNVMTINFRRTVETNETENIFIDYYLPWNEFVSQQNGVDYTLQFTFYEQFNSTIEELTVSITLPIGAQLQSSSPEPERLAEDGLQDTLFFSFSEVSMSQDLNFSINYKYLVFWGSFYPTIWVGILAVVGAVIFFFWGGPKPVSVPTVQVQPKDLKSFVEAYEEKAEIRSQLDDLEEHLQKGKISRRRYKIRKKMLDGRFSAISRNLSTIIESIRAAGSNYADLLRQIEVAEAKHEDAEKDIQRLKSRYSRGEISKGAYGKLLEEYKSRIEEAEATIDGVLLRLRD